MGVEAVVMFDPALGWEFELRRKRGAHLFSKHRYLAAQMQAYLDGRLWLALARQPTPPSRGWSKGCAAVPAAPPPGSPPPPTSPSSASPAPCINASAPPGRSTTFGRSARLLRPRGGALLCRLVCDWSTGPGTVDRFLAVAAGQPVPTPSPC